MLIVRGHTHPRRPRRRPSHMTSCPRRPPCPWRVHWAPWVRPARERDVGRRRASPPRPAAPPRSGAAAAAHPRPRPVFNTPHSCTVRPRSVAPPSSPSPLCARSSTYMCEFLLGRNVRHVTCLTDTDTDTFMRAAVSYTSHSVNYTAAVPRGPQRAALGASGAEYDPD
jgi:hypothetical protein